MILGQAQQFASPMEALSHVSETPWSNWSKADYTLQQWHAACLVHTHEGKPTAKSQCKLPVKTPDGALNRHGVHAAAAALAGARGGLKGVSAEQKKKAAAALRRYYSQLDEDPPESLAVHAIIGFREKPGTPSDVLEHYGVKGMRWGVRKANRQFAKRTKLRSEAEALNARGNLRSRHKAQRKVLKANRLETAVTQKVMGQTIKAARKDLDKLRKRPEFQDINYQDATGKSRFNVDKFRALEKEESRIWTHHLNNTVSGYEFDVRVGDNSWQLVPKEVKHDAISMVRVKPIRDEDGYLVDVELLDIQEVPLAQSIDLGETFVLEHYGVKGMRWGVRKQEETSERSSTGKIESLEGSKPVLSERKQRRVEKFMKRSEIMGARVSELKLKNEALEGTKDPIELFQRHLNKADIKTFERAQKQALSDAEAVQQGKLTSTQKKAIVGAVAVGAVLAVGVGAVAVSQGQQSGALNSAMLRSSAFLRGQKTPFNVDKSLSKPMSSSELLSKVAKPVNPGYAKAGGKMNCRRSTYAYELRRRGYDVHATTSALGWGQSESGVINAVTPGSRNFYDAMSMSQAVVQTGRSSVARGDTRINPVKKILLDGLSISPEEESRRVVEAIKRGGENFSIEDIFKAGQQSSSRKVLEELAKQPNGARGEVLFKFPGFGHSMAYEVVDGVPHIFDSQKGQLYNAATKMVESKWDGFTAAEITRLDNVNLDLNFLTRWADNN